MQQPQGIPLLSIAGYSAWQSKPRKIRPGAWSLGFAGFWASELYDASPAEIDAFVVSWGIDA